MLAFLPIIIGSVIASWAMLLLIGAERERRSAALPPASPQPNLTLQPILKAAASKPAAAKPATARPPAKAA